MNLGKLIGIGGILFICFAGWQIGGMLSTDALGMALGVVFGMMAGIPAAMIAMAGRPTEVHNHFHAPAPQEAQEEPQRAIRSTRYTVVIPSLPVSESKSQNKLLSLR